MQPENPSSAPESRGTRPAYPTPEYYQNLENLRQQQPPAPATYLPQSRYFPTPANGGPQSGTGNPYLPRPNAPRIRTHNAFTRFLVAWGGGQRLLISLGTMALSVVVYYYFWRSWALAVGITVLILIHELGHALALRFKKLPATFPIFIPGIGAYVTLPNRPISSRDHVDISLAGPFAGGLSAIACLAISFFVDPFQAYLWRELAYWGFFLNLLNMLPILPLDGGHVAVLLSRWLAYAGIALLAIGFLITRNFFLIYLGFIGIPMTLNSLNLARIGMRVNDQIISWAMYVGLGLALFAGLFFTFLAPYFQYGFSQN